MDFIDEVRAFAKKCERLIDKLATEEATKHALCPAVSSAAQYNVFDPTEVVRIHSRCRNQEGREG